jgi:C4-dicarboxylate-binding protein DctP
MKQSGLLGVLAVAVATVVGAGAVDAADVNMKIAHVVPQKAPRGQGAVLVAKMATEDKRCDIQAQDYPSAQLGGTTDLIEGLQDGSIEMVILPASFLVGFQPLLGIMDFPFFWPPNKDDLAKIHKGPAMKALLDTTEEIGVTSVAVWHTGYKTWTGNKPLNKYANYAGLTARVMPSPVLKKQDELLGVKAVGMPFKETYSALKNKSDQVIMMSKVWWDKLSADCRTAIGEAVDAGGKLTTDLTYSIIEAKAMGAFKAAGMEVVEVSPAEFAEMKAKVLPGVEEFYVEQNGDRGRKILEAFKKEM